MKTFTLAQLAALVNGRFDPAAGSIPITGVAAAAEAEAGDLTFFGNAKYLGAIRQTRASAVLVPPDFAEPIPATCIRVENPSVAFARIAREFAPPDIHFAPGVHPTAVIGEGVVLGRDVSIQPHAVIEPGATIGDRTIIGANCYIGHGARLGADCRLYPLVTIREACVLGDRVVIHSGSVIGSDGFGYEPVEGRHVKIPQTGIVQIDDDVEIGACVTVDRARFGRTWIQCGTKIDNLVQIAHNVVIGPHCIVVSQTGISGSTRLGHHVILAGQVGLVGHITIGDGAVIGAKSGVSKSVPAGEQWFGIPAVPGRQFKERVAFTNRLGQLFERVRELEKQVAQLRPRPE